MYKIRDEQFEAIATERSRYRIATIVARLRSEMPDNTKAVATDDLERQVEKGIKAAEMLEIIEFDHIYRYLRLHYIPTNIWERPSLSTLSWQVLMDTAVDAELRLRFVEVNVGIGS